MSRRLVKSAIIVAVFTSTAFVLAQQSALAEPQESAPAATEKPRVFITDSQSWEMRGSAGGANGAFAAHSQGGARPQTAEIIKTFGERCPDVTVNNKQELADYIVVLDHEGGKGYLQHRNKVAVFEHISGDVVISHSTLSLGGSVEEACKGIGSHWAAHSKEILAAKPKTLAAPPVSQSSAVSQPATPAAQGVSVTVDSTPTAADIAVDGGFVGNTPSTIILAPGSHDISVTKKGFADWTRKMNVTGGSVHLNPSRPYRIACRQRRAFGRRSCRAL
jgi:PEGA domain